MCGATKCAGGSDLAIVAPARKTTADVIMPAVPLIQRIVSEVRPQAKYADCRDNGGNCHGDQLSTLVFSGHSSRSFDSSTPFS